MEKPRRPVRSSKRIGYHHGDLRRVLVEAALAVIAEQGIEALSLRELARQTGVSAAAPYRHFTDKDELLAAVAADCAGRLLEVMGRAVESSPPNEPLKRWQATGIAQVQFAVDNPAHFRVMQMPGVRTRMPASAREALDHWYAGERERLIAAQQAHLIAPFPIEQLLLAARSVMNGLAQLMISDDPQVKDLSPAQIVSVARRVTEVFALGVLPRSDGRRRKTAVRPR
jgi:AcrR family transcriptional regulator